MLLISDKKSKSSTKEDEWFWQTKIEISQDEKSEKDFKDVMDIMERKEMVKQIAKKIEFVTQLIVQIMKKQDFVFNQVI